jgi:hypothetical protein
MVSVCMVGDFEALITRLRYRINAKIDNLFPHTTFIETPYWPYHADKREI